MANLANQHDATFEVDYVAIPNNDTGEPKVVHGETTTMGGLFNAIHAGHDKLGKVANPDYDYDIRITFSPLEFRMTPREIPGYLTRVMAANANTD